MEGALAHWRPLCVPPLTSSYRLNSTLTTVFNRYPPFFHAIFLLSSFSFASRSFFGRWSIARVACVALSVRVITLVDIPTKHQNLVVPRPPHIHPPVLCLRHIRYTLAASINSSPLGQITHSRCDQHSSSRPLWQCRLSRMLSRAPSTMYTAWPTPRMSCLDDKTTVCLSCRLFRTRC